MKTFICVLSISRPLNSLTASSLLISRTLWPNGECCYSTGEMQHVSAASSHVIEISDIILSVFLCVCLLVWLKTLQTERTWRCWWWEHIYVFMQNNIKSKCTLFTFMINVLDRAVSIIIIIIIEVNINQPYHITHFSQSNQMLPIIIHYDCPDRIIYCFLFPTKLHWCKALSSKHISNALLCLLSWSRSYAFTIPSQTI